MQNIDEEAIIRKMNDNNEATGDITDYDQIRVVRPKRHKKQRRQKLFTKESSVIGIALGLAASLGYLGVEYFFDTLKNDGQPKCEITFSEETNSTSRIRELLSKFGDNRNEIFRINDPYGYDKSGLPEGLEGVPASERIDNLSKINIFKGDRIIYTKVDRDACEKIGGKIIENF